jgi:hypothetical protein
MITFRFNTLKRLGTILILVSFCSCSHYEPVKREVASDNCTDQSKPEYHSYFDSYEKCIENREHK